MAATRYLPTKTAVTPSRPPGFRSDIEGLRGIAVLAVVLFHCGVGGFSGGFVGVDIFFALSGCLITGILVSEVEKTSRIDLLRFYARRVRRLLPASTVALLATLLIAAAFLAPNEIASAARAGRASALYASNIFFALNSADYFAPDVRTNPLLHTWSLAVEEQFYLFWPLPIMLGLRIRRSKNFLVLLLSSITLGSLTASVWFTARSPAFAFYEIPTRAWEFGAGGIAAVLAWRTLKAPPAVWLVVGYLGMLAILGPVYFFSEKIAFPGWLAVLPVLGTVAVLVAGSERPHCGASLILDCAPLQTLGKLSYSWYLWHWPFIVFASALLSNITAVGKASAAAAALAVAAVSQRFIENPIRFNPGLSRRPGRTLSLAVAAALLSFSAAELSIRFAAGLASAGRMKTIAEAVDDIATLPREQCVSLGSSSKVQTCSFGNESSSTSILLFGDSHAIQWFNPLRRMAESRNFRLIALVKSGCPAADINPPGDGIGACSAWRRDAIRYAVALRPTVMVVANATRYVKFRGTTRDEVVSLDEWRDGIRRTLRILNEEGMQVVAVRDTPQPGFDVPTCLARIARYSSNLDHACEFKTATSSRRAVFDAEKEGARGLKNVRFIDLTGQLCHGDTCWSFQNGLVVYRDDNHLTGRYSDSLMSALAAQLLPILGRGGLSR